MAHIERIEVSARIDSALKRSRVVALLGPRQSGKTTLARQFLSPNSANYFDLEDPESLSRLAQPKTALASLEGLVVIDEVQLCPNLFPLLRVLADRQPLPAKFLILGSAAPELLRQGSESLAGRIETIEIGGFTLNEVGASNHRQHWLKGGLPLSYLAENAESSLAWRKLFVQTFVNQDLASFGLDVDRATMSRFWAMVAH